MKTRFSLVSILIFGALSVLLVLAVALASRLTPPASPASAAAAYPPPATPGAKSTKLPGLAKSPEPTKPAVRQAPTATPGPTPVVLENGWYLYTNSAAGYSISYPPNVQIDVSENLVVRLQFKIADCKCGYVGMTIRIKDNANNFPIESIIKEWHKGGDLDNISAETIRQAWIPFKIGPTTAYKTTFRPFFYDFSIFVPYKDRVALLLPVHDTAAMEMDPKAVALFDQIMATFTVLP